ncbi:MAG: universal stress protein [Cyclobacteriaceae bacterium]
MRRIIVPTDYSNAAWNAFLYAVELAGHLEGEILLLNAYHEPHGSATTMHMLDKVMQKDSEKGMEKLLEKIETTGAAANVTVQGKSVHLGVVDALNSQIKEHDQQFIVIGSLGETGALEKMIGSTASAVVNKAKCPVFVIPPDATFVHEGRLVYSVGLNHVPENEDISLLMQLTRLTSLERLDAVHVKDGSKTDAEIRSLVDSLFKDIPFDVHIISGGDVADVLAEYVGESKNDLLVLVKKKRGLLHRIFKESVIKEITLGAERPLLILKAQQ